MILRVCSQSVVDSLGFVVDSTYFVVNSTYFVVNSALFVVDYLFQVIRVLVSSPSWLAWLSSIVSIFC